MIFVVERETIGNGGGIGSILIEFRFRIVFDSSWHIIAYIFPNYHSNRCLTL